MRISLGPPFSARLGMASLALVVTLSGCEKLGITPAEGAPTPPASTSINRDIERSDIFSVSENALWDGRPSLGGVWVAYPANVDPERVLIRNTKNGKTVIGALFRRERDNPGPKIQLSSDAAVALGVVAGTPTEISIIVLRREEVVVELPEEAAAPVDDNMTIPPRRAAVAMPAPIAPAAISEQALSSITTSETSVASTESTSIAAEVSSLFRLRKPYIQVGTFSTASNATALVETLIAAGVQASSQANDAENPTLWRVISGPYAQRAERSAQLQIIKELGYNDAFFFK